MEVRCALIFARCKIWYKLSFVLQFSSLPLLAFLARTYKNYIWSHIANGDIDYPIQWELSDYYLQYEGSISNKTAENAPSNIEREVRSSDHCIIDKE